MGKVGVACFTGEVSQGSITRMPTRFRFMVLCLALLPACQGPAGEAPTEDDRAPGLPPLARLPFDGAEASSVVITDSLAFVGCGEQGLRIVDISEPRMPVPLTSVEDQIIDSLAVKQDTLYILGHTDSLFGSERNLTVVEVLDPRDPGPSRRTEKDGVGDRPSLSVDIPHIAIAAGENGFIVENIRTMAPYPSPSEDHGGTAIAVLIQNNTLFGFSRTSDFDFGLGYGDRSEHLLLADPETGETRALLNWEIPDDTDGPGSIALSGRILLLANGSELRTIDVSNPARPLALETMAAPGVTAIAAEGEVGVMVDGNLKVLDLSIASKPRISRQAVTRGTARDVDIRGSIVAVADGAAGLVLFQLPRNDE